MEPHMGRMLLIKFIILSVCFLKFTCASGKSKIVHLNEDNWEQILSGEWMVEFYAPWCPACKSLGPVWKDFSSWSEDLDIHIGQVDVTTDVGLSGRFMVTALPTIYHVYNGEFRQYRGARDKDEFISFIEDTKWKQIEPIPSWKSPSTIQMSVVSHFYKLSMVLRSVHTGLMEDYGVPMWGSYLIFALITIVVGALLGLLLVCFIDFIYPPKPIEFTGGSSSGDAKAESEVDDNDDEDGIKDDRVEASDSDVEDEEEEEEEGSQADDQEDASPPSSAPGSPSVRRRKPPHAD